ncbi:MAG: STAS domain-containing protein [Ignavibacteria bacterium]|nr:STAS domain-containing protein [Ignavibacteria bacterium]
MNLTIEHNNEITVVRVNETKINSENSPDLKAKLLIEAQPNLKALIIDISKVESIDSSGFGAFLLADRQLREHGIPTIIVGVRDNIKHLFEILKLDRVFGFCNSVEEALETI